MKSWADEQDDSSDEDDEVTPIIPPSGFTSIGNAKNNSDNNNNDNIAVVEAAAIEVDTTYQIPPKEFILPTQAPYTAFLGNLPYDIRNSNDLGREVEALLQERQCAALANRFTNARLMMEKGSNTSRGYGYVDFETDGELLEFLHLPNPQLCGRNIKVDVAISTPRTSSARSGGGSGRGERVGRDSCSNRGSDSRDGRGKASIRNNRQYSDRSDSDGRVDGSQFMGGRYAGGRSNSGNNLNSSVIGGGGGKTTPTAVMRRVDSSASQGTRDAEDAAPADVVTKQRPSLKLLARSKPLDNASSSAMTTQSSIFGGAKPRDESKFVAAQAEAAVETKAVDDTRKDLASSVAKMVVSKSDVSAPVSDLAVGNSNSLDNNGSEATETLAALTPENNDKEPPKTNHERKDSRGGGGRGGSGRGRGGNRNRENGDGKREGRRDSTVKSGRGERGAGGKGRGSSEGRGEGRSTNNERRNSKSTKNGSSTASGKNNAESGKGKSGGVSSLAAAAAAATVAGEAIPKSLPTMPTASEIKKGPPKKVNSFAAFMDDSDSD